MGSEPLPGPGQPVVAVAEAPPSPVHRLHGRRLTFVRVAWVIVVGLALVAFSVALPDYYQSGHTVATTAGGSLYDLTFQDLRLMEQYGLSLDFYAAYGVAQVVFFLLLFSPVAVLLFWRKPDEPMALFASSWFMLLGATGSPVFEPLLATHPGWTVPVRMLQGVSFACIPIFAYVFPDGRFVPRWTRVVALVWLVGAILSPFTPFPISDAAGPSPLWFGVLVPLGVGLGVVAQVYRYRRVSNHAQRQQTKWMLFGFLIVAVGFALYGLLPVALPSLARPSLARILYLNFGPTVFLLLPFSLLPVCIGLAILRYHLWDIDLIVRRTLVYSIVSAVLALVYFGGVILLQSVFEALTGQTSPLAVVASTLSIAALFTPLRRLVQDAVDRRFYRRRYNAQQVLDRFAATVRDETDIDRLEERLLAIVEDTMQPAQVGLWLRAAGQRERRSP